eukprot:222754-Chlamydomonas_euryale.AAC.4
MTRSLRLRVDHERPAPRACDHDAVVDGEGVVGQSGDAPLADPDRIPQHRRQAELPGAGHAACLQVCHPLPHDLVAVCHREGAQVGDHAGRHQHVAGEVDVLCGERGRGLGPPCLLPSQALDELLGTFQLLGA